VFCNRSLCDEDLPASQKRSLLVPVLKAEGLDVTVPVNFRPIANVSFLSKQALESVARFPSKVYILNGLFSAKLSVPSLASSGQQLFDYMLHYDGLLLMDAVAMTPIQPDDDPCHVRCFSCHESTMPRMAPFLNYWAADLF